MDQSVTFRKRVYKNYGPKKINPLCNLRDLSKLSIIHFLGKFRIQELRDE